MTTTTKGARAAKTAALDLVSAALDVGREAASKRIQLGCPTTSAEAAKAWWEARRGPTLATADVLEVVEGRAVVRRHDSLLTGIASVRGVKLPARIRGCCACVEALQGLRGEADLTPREKQHGTRVLHVARVWHFTHKGSEERLVSRCGTCGHKLRTLKRAQVHPDLWSAVPVARIT